LKRIEIDVTTSGLNQKELLNEYQLFGPPAFIFINAQGQEVQKLRVVGIISPEKLQEKLRLLRQK
jgi:thiol:disulfide interchange protein DsbD